MRDGNRLKEKIEVRLDQRQAATLVVVALLLAGVLFGLGVMVGKNLATLPGRGPPSAEALLDRLDAKARPDAASDGLTFQEDLTRRNPNPALSPQGAPAAIQPSSQSAPAVRAQPKPDAGPKGNGVAAKTPTPTPTANPTATATANPTATPTPTPTPTSPTKVAAANPAPSTVDTPPPSPAMAPIPALPPPPDAMGPPAPGAGYTLQIKSTQSQEEADHFVRKLKGQGYHAFVVTADLPGKGRWYRVRLGKFDSKDAAEHYLKDFKRETKLGAFVTAGGK
jgi:DedD protein